MEIVITVAIVGILVSIVNVSYDTVKARARYSKLKGDMDGIAQAAYNDYTTNNNTWALNVMPGDPPSFVNSGELLLWPSTPCPNWFYSWENYSAVPAVKAVRVTLHKGDLSAYWSYCLANEQGTCLGDDGTGVPLDVSSVDTPYIYCNE